MYRNTVGKAGLSPLAECNGHGDIPRSLPPRPILLSPYERSDTAFPAQTKTVRSPQMDSTGVDGRTYPVSVILSEDPPRKICQREDNPLPGKTPRKNECKIFGNLARDFPRLT